VDANEAGIVYEVDGTFETWLLGWYCGQRNVQRETVVDSRDEESLVRVELIKVHWATLTGISNEQRELQREKRTMVSHLKA
jgi:hypothetical protein